MRMEGELNDDQERAKTPISHIKVADLYEDAEDLEDDEKISKSAKTGPTEQKTQVLTQTSSLAPSTAKIAGSFEHDERETGRREKALHEIPESLGSEHTQIIDQINGTQLVPRTKNDQLPEVRDQAPASTEQDLQAFQITQLDSKESLLFQTTAPDSPKISSTLKTHEVPRQLIAKSLKAGSNRNVECGNFSRPFATNLAFSKESFLKEFNGGSSSEEETVDTRKQDVISKHEEEGHSLSRNTKHDQRKSLLSVYEHKLKCELDARRCIALHDEDDSDNSVTLLSSRASKATILDIKARNSRQESIIRTRQKRTTTNELIQTLKKASKKQISNHQRELMERRGYKLEDIEKEKEEVDNLLEQEIARNKRLAQRERREATSAISDEESYRSADESTDAGFSDEYSNPRGSDSEEESEDEKTLYAEGKKSHVEPSNQEGKGVKDEDEEQHDKEETLFQKKRKKNRRPPIVEDLESDEERSFPRNIIDLGPYGNNLEKNSLTQDDVFEINQRSAAEEKRKRDLFFKRVRESRMKQEKKEQRLRELKATGFNKMLEMEAEESEDEWHGIGGKDGEVSEDNDSELEEMIDDFAESDENLDGIRQLLAKENKEMDEKMVNRILHDIKTGGFRKRGRNGLQMSLSDDDDEDLRAYRLKRRDIIRKTTLENKENEILFRDSKSKAFLQSMVEDIDESKNPFGEVEQEKEDSREFDTQRTEEDTKTGKRTISQEFVQQRLSFLNEIGDSQEFKLGDDFKRVENEQDLSSLKRNSSICTLPYTANDRRPNKTEDDNSDNFISLQHLKSPSLVKSFAARANPKSKFQSGTKTVTVSKSYRAVGGNRSSITYFGKSRKLVAPRRNVRSSSKDTERFSRSSIGKLFGSQGNHFET